MRELMTVEEFEYQQWVNALDSSVSGDGSFSLGSYEALRKPAEFVPATKRERKKKPYVASEKKRCPHCKCDRLRVDFYTQPSRKDGLSSWCRDCLRVDKKMKKTMTEMDTQESLTMIEALAILLKKCYSVLQNYPYWDEQEVFEIMEEIDEISR